MGNKIKDILYDHNDLLVGLLIVAVAAVVIWSRIDAIMDYPQVLAAEQSAQSQSEEPADLSEPSEEPEEQPPAEEPEEQPPAEEPQTEPEEQTAPENPQTPVTPEPQDRTIVIPSGASGETIGDTLAAAGLVGSRSEFTTAVEAAGLATKLQAGTFKIPVGASMEEILKILTK